MAGLEPDGPERVLTRTERCGPRVIPPVRTVTPRRLTRTFLRPICRPARPRCIIVARIPAPGPFFIKMTSNIRIYSGNFF